MATRERAGLFDESSFAKIEVIGRGAARSSSGCRERRRAGRPGRSYTQMLNTRGGIECDLTVTRLADDRFMFVTGTASATTTSGGSAGTATEGSTT